MCVFVYVCVCVCASPSIRLQRRVPTYISLHITNEKIPALQGDRMHH